MQRRGLMLLGLGAALVLVLGTALAAAPTVTGSGTLARGTIGKLKARNDGVTLTRRTGSTDVVVARYVFQPGSSSGWHKHRGVTLVTIKSGTLQVFNRRCQKKVYSKGETFVERGYVHLARNRGDVKAIVVPTFIIPTKTPASRLTIPRPAPEGCNIQ